MESRHLIADFKEQSRSRLAALQDKISSAIGTILEKDLNIQDDKGIAWATERYIFHLQGRVSVKKLEAM
jgi:hypothetical protein